MKNSTIKKTISYLISIVLLMVLYEIIYITKDNEVVFPKLTDVILNAFKILFNGHNLLLVGKLLLNVFLIVIVEVIFCLIISFIYPKFIYIDSFFKVLNSIFKSMPFLIISLYLFIFLFNKRNIIPFIVTFITTFPVIYEGIMAKVKTYPKGLRDDLALLQGPYYEKYYKAVFPFTINGVLTSSLQSFGMGIKVIIMVEYLASLNNTIGMIIHDALINVDYVSVLSWLVVIIILVLIIDILINKLLNIVNKQFE